MTQLTVINRLHQSRADAAAKLLQEAAAALEKEERNVAMRQEALDKQRLDAAREENEIYARLFRDPVRRNKLDEAMIDVQTVRNRTVQCETALMEAQRKLETARDAHQKAHAQHRAQVIKLEKFASLLDEEKRSAAAGAQMAEDAALDEVVELTWKRHAH